MMKHILTIISSAFLFLLPLGLYAQQAGAPRTINGIVSDDLGPMMSVNVSIEDRNGRTIRGVVTDHSGAFLLNVPDEDDLTIVASYVGYKTQRIPYTGQRTLNITMQSQSTQMQGIIVEAERDQPLDGFGLDPTTQGTATEKIDIAQFQEMAVTSVEDMLIGKIAGMDIVGGGDPGTSSTIRIRGTSSLNANNEPLIVIDGVPQNVSIDPDFDFADADVEAFGSLVNIAPNDIQSIEVLKDAAATALWGDKAANGVLIIKTKEGGNHTPRFSISEKVSYSFAPKKFPLLNGSEYSTLIQDAMWNWTRDGGFAADRLNKLKGQRDILYDQSWQYYDEYSRNTDWLDLVTQDGINSNTDFAMSGGGDKATYRFSLSYNNEKGTTIGVDYTRITSRLNVTYKFSNKFRVTSNFSYLESTRNRPFEGHKDTGDELGSPRSIAMKKMPNMSPYVLDEFGNYTDEYFTAPDGNVLQSGMANPVAQVNESMNRTFDRNIGASFSTEYNFMNGPKTGNLTGSAQLAFNLYTTRNHKYLPESVINVPWSHNNYNKGTEGLNNSVVTYMQLQLRYNKMFKKRHSISATVTEQLEAKVSNSYSVSTSGNSAAEVSLPSAGGKVTAMGSGRSMNRTLGLVGTVSYNYDRRYFITFTSRLNANSDRALGSKWSKPRLNVNGRWNVHNEKWLKSAVGQDKWLNEIVFGASFGRSENIQGIAKTTGTYNDSGYYGQGNWVSILPEQMQLYNIQPELKTMFNVSFQGLLLKGKIFIDVNYYTEKTKNQTQENARIPSNTGFTQLRVYNSGIVGNRGFDGSINFRDILVFGKRGDKEGVDKRVRISLDNVNFSRNRNRIIELPSNIKAERYTLGNGNLAKKVIVNTPVGSIYGFQFGGIYQNYDETVSLDQYGNQMKDLHGNLITTMVGNRRTRPGDVRYVDQNYDGVIDEYDIVYLGNSYPSVIGGLTLRINWRSFTFRTSMQMRLGNVIFNDARLNSEQMGDANNQSTNALARWRYEGEITEIPRALWGTNYNSLVSDLYIEDGSFFKIKDVTLNYRLPRKFVQKLGLQSANVFFNAYNILTLTKYSGVDPEVGMTNEKAFSITKDISKTPPARRIAFGLSFEF